MLKKLLLAFFVLIFHTNLAMSPTIRHIKESDSLQFRQLYQTVAQNTRNFALLPDEVTDEFIAELIHETVTSGLGLLVEFDGQLIGWMLKYRYPYQTLRHIFYGGSIGIHPNFQGQGIGTQLISKFLSEVAEHHKDILRVEIYVLESSPAYRLYKRLGL